MNPLLQEMLPYVETYKYFAVFVFTFLGAIALPIPTGTMMVAAGFFASLGYFELLPLIVIAILGNVVGDNLGYLLARKVGLRLTKYPGFHRFRTKRLLIMEKHVQEHPFITIFLSRFLTAVAPSVNIVAGLAKMKYWRYLFYEFFGEITEVNVTVFIGFWFGEQWEQASKYVIVFILLLAVGIYLSAYFWKRLTRNGEAEGKIFASPIQNAKDTL